VTEADPLRPAPPDGFCEFFRRTYRSLVRVARYAGASQEEAEDAAAETMAEVLARWNLIEKPDNYAYRATVNTFIRHRVRSQERLRERLVERGFVGSSVGADGMPVEWESRQWVTDLLKTLSPTRQQVMALLVDGYSAGEIAERLSKTPEAVRKNIQLAREQLRRQLECSEPRQEIDPARRHISGREDV